MPQAKKPGVMVIGGSVSAIVRLITTRSVYIAGQSSRLITHRSDCRRRAVDSGADSAHGRGGADVEGADSGSNTCNGSVLT